MRRVQTFSTTELNGVRQ